MCMFFSIQPVLYTKHSNVLVMLIVSVKQTIYIFCCAQFQRSAGYTCSLLMCFKLCVVFTSFDCAFRMSFCSFSVECGYAPEYVVYGLCHVPRFSFVNNVVGLWFGFFMEIYYYLNKVCSF